MQFLRRISSQYFPFGYPKTTDFGQISQGFWMREISNVSKSGPKSKITEIFVKKIYYPGDFDVAVFFKSRENRNQKFRSHFWGHFIVEK